MRPFRFSARERSLLLWSGLLIGCLVVPLRVFPALREWRAEVITSAAGLIAEAERAERQVRSLAATLDSLEQRRDRLVALSPVLVPGATPSSAAGALAAQVSGAATAHSVELGAVQLHVDTTGTGIFARVGVRTTATGDVRGILRFLSELEKGPPFVAVRDWSVSQSDPAAPSHEPESLRLDLLVEGLTFARRDARAR